MPVLTNPKWELFAQGVAQGKSGAEAYQEAGYHANAKAAAVNANRLLKDASVRARVDELLADRDNRHLEATERAIERLSIDREWVLAKLVENVQRAMQAAPVRLGDDGEAINGEYRYEGSVANRALELLGKELGMFIDRKEVRTGQLDDLPRDERQRAIDALRSELARRAGRPPAPGSSGPH